MVERVLLLLSTWGVLMLQAILVTIWVA